MKLLLSAPDADAGAGGVPDGGWHQLGAGSRDGEVVALRDVGVHASGTNYLKRFLPYL